MDNGLARAVGWQSSLDPAICLKGEGGQLQDESLEHKILSPAFDVDRLTSSLKGPVICPFRLAFRLPTCHASSFETQSAITLSPALALFRSARMD
jgi:hypothetical protein